MDCQFGEERYKGALNLELALKGSLFSPDQVLEHTLGIDAALFSKNKDLWKIFSNRPSWHFYFPIDFWLRGVSLESGFWDDLEEKLNDHTFPKIKCNVFFQYKRPEYIKLTRGKEYVYWNIPYFRYDIDDNQQTILFNLEQRVKENAIVAYACPSFWRNTELNSFQEKKVIIKNSNFVKPSVLIGHSRYTFTSSGKFGKAFSDHSNIEHFNFLDELDKIWDKNVLDNNSDLLQQLSIKIIELMEKDETIYRSEFNILLENLNQIEHPLPRNIVSIRSFCNIINASWFIGLEFRDKEDPFPKINENFPKIIYGLSDAEEHKLLLVQPF